MGKVVMGDNNEEIGLTDVVVAQPVIADQNELIMQLMQQITKMRVEMQRRQDLPNPVFAFNAQADERPPLHFPPSSAEQAQNPPSNPAQNPLIIDLTTQNPHYASASYQTPPPPQSTNPRARLPPQNANLHTYPPPQNQNVNNPKPPSITKINIPARKLSLKTIKPLKMPRVPLLHPYPKKPLPKSRSPMSMMPMVLNSTTMRP